MKKHLIIFVTFILIVIISSILYSKYIEPYHFITKEIKITANIPTNFNGFKIVHISDIYYGTTIKKDEFNNIINEINLLKPDIVVITGNLFDDSITLSVEDYDELDGLLNSIDANISKYIIKVNTDIDTKWNDIITNGGFIDISDKYNLIYDNGNEPIIISGISTNLDGSNINDKLLGIDTYINSLNSKPYSILLMHEPDYISSINLNDFNLVLSGNSNQINLGNFNLNEGSKIYNNSYYKIDNTDIYITNGLGTKSNNPYRFMNIPTINFYRIVKNNS